MKNPLFTILVLWLTLSSCSEPKNTNRLDSDDFKTQVKRVNVLKKEIKSPSDFSDAEFELFNVNGFSDSRTTIPGASSLDYKFVIKVAKEDVDKWIKGMVKAPSNSTALDWTTAIIEQRKSNWTTNSTPEFYSRQNDNVIMIVYRNEGIIFKRVSYL